MGKPVATTPLDVFAGVRDLVFTLPGISEDDIADGIVNILSNQNNRLRKDLSKKSVGWLNQNSFSVLGKRIYGLIKALESSKSI